MQKWCLSVWLMGFFWACPFFLPQPLAQENETNGSAPSMEERTLGSRGVLKVPEPEFIEKGSSAREQGVYFGVGFQRVRLDFFEGPAVISTDATTNGVAFNLGYFTQTHAFEYVRHVALLELEETLVVKNQLFSFVEVVQNNWWYFRTARLTPNWYAHYGLGLQVARARLVLQEFRKPPGTPESDDTSQLYRENSFLFGLGSSYFFTPNFFVQYRFTYGSYSSFLSESTASPVLNSTQNHTLFLQYYFSL